MRRSHDSCDCGNFPNNYDTCPVPIVLRRARYLRSTSVYVYTTNPTSRKYARRARSPANAQQSSNKTALAEQKVHTIIVSLIWKSMLLLWLMLRLLLAAAAVAGVVKHTHKSLNNGRSTIGRPVAESSASAYVAQPNEALCDCLLVLRPVAGLPVGARSFMRM